MTSTASIDSTPTPQPPGLGSAAPGADDGRVAYLFRHSQQASRVHVLQHLIQRWRAQRPGGAEREPPAARVPGTTAAAMTAPIDLGLLRQRIAQLPALPR